MAGGTVIDVSDAAIGRENFHLWSKVGVGANEVLGRGVSILAQASGKSTAQDFGKSYGWKGNAGFRLAFSGAMGRLPWVGALLKAIEKQR